MRSFFRVLARLRSDSSLSTGGTFSSFVICFHLCNGVLSCKCYRTGRGKAYRIGKLYRSTMTARIVGVVLVICSIDPWFLYKSCSFRSGKHVVLAFGPPLAREIRNSTNMWTNWLIWVVFLVLKKRRSKNFLIIHFLLLNLLLIWVWSAYIRTMTTLITIL